MVPEKTPARSSGILWTIRYTLINATYFSAFCTIHACAAVFLLGNGFTNTEVGVLLALANILSAIAQPVIAGIIDKQGALTNRRFILISVLVILAGSVILLFTENNKFLIFPIFALIYMIQFAYQPVMTALCFEYQKAGCSIMYGLARGLGSASFAVTSAFIGGLIEDHGIRILLYINIAVMALSAILIFTFKKPVVKAVPSGEDAASGDAEKAARSSSFPAFIKAYPAFSLFLVGVICFFFAHNMINDFMIQIIRNLGGAEKELGYANFLQAILELPVMAMIGLILKKFTSRALLLFSGVAFLVKIIILIFATNMGHMYLSQSCQLFAYAVFIPAAAYYVSKTMADHDQVKGQAFVTSAITIGGVFSNLISGVILDNLGIRPMLVTGTVVCAAGVGIACYALLKLPAKRTE
ncbi:MAG: MFS transporter [Clostridiales bacterium]|nr:MFS transporter [Clostridiales bacterium]MBR6254869.1 MFS transporter [Clostridiales bacterium]